jgi:hypothetical protein
VNDLVWCSKKLITCKVTPKFVSFCYFVNIIQYVEGFALQRIIIVLVGQIKSGDFRDKCGKISD